MTLTFGVTVAACAVDAGAPPPADSTAGGAVTLELVGTDAGSVALGEPFHLRLVAGNEGERSVSIEAALVLTSPAGDAIPFATAGLFVPHGGEASQDLAVTPAQWFADPGSYELSASIAEPVAAEASLAFDVTEPAIVVPEFEDVTAAAGLTTSVPEAECGQFANGAAWGDIDGDGDLDLLVTRLGEPVQLFVNDGTGHFTEEAAARGISVAGANGAAFADYDNDGHQDLVVVRDGPDLLFHNDGTGRFTDVSAAAGIGDDDRRGISASWGDFDADGHLDLYITNYIRCTGEWETDEDIIANVAYEPDTLYRNDGDGTFTDVTSYLGEDATSGAGFAAAWLDYDGDGLLDLFLANDFVGVSPDHNRLWRNDGPAGDGTWRFTDVSEDSGTALWMNTMGIAVGDVDRDGHLDLALSNIAGNKLLRNDGDGRFTEDPASGVVRPLQQAGTESITWGGGFHDLNLAGWEDLYLAAGTFAGVRETGVQPNQLFANQGGTTFLDVSAATGADDPGDSKGVAFADYDGDGRIDMYVVNQGGEPRLYRNVTPYAGNHWLAVDTVGTVSNRDGCGAVVSVTAAGATMTRQVMCGSTSVASGHDAAAHFGLGAADAVDELEVRWPSGIRQRLTDVTVDGVITVEEADG